MKKLKNVLALVLFAVILALTPVEQASAAAAPKLNKTSVAVKRGKSVRLKVRNLKKGRKVTWKSSNKSVASVNSSGKVTGKKSGTAKITATAKGFKAVCKVSVYVEINSYNISMGSGTVSEMHKFADAVGGMKKKNSWKYPTLCLTGNKMLIGVNKHAVCNSSRDEYIRIENKGNKQIQFYGVKIGDTRKQMEKKFKKHNMWTWDNGKTYTNCIIWSIKPVFKNGKLKSFSCSLKPTS